MESKAQLRRVGMLLLWGFVVLFLLNKLYDVLWTATLPLDSPTTKISETYSNGKSGRTSYIKVNGESYWCAGSGSALRGTVVAYDASNPERCRRPEHLGTVVWTEWGYVIVLLGIAGFQGFLLLPKREPERWKPSDTPPD